MTLERPVTRYADVADGQVAYQAFGEGELDIVFVPGFAGSIDLNWDWPPWVHFYGRLASFSRAIIFDRRGSGSSDAISVASLSSWEEWAQDLTAVLDATGSEDSVIFAAVDAAAWGLLFAATSPERTRALILLNPSVGGSGHQSLDVMREVWGTPALVDLVDPEVAAAGGAEWSARVQRLSCTPKTAVTEFRYALEMDARSVLDAVQAPTLVLHNQGSIIPTSNGHYIAGRVPGARFVEISGEGVTSWIASQHAVDVVLDAVEEFVTGIKPPGRTDRVLATVMFTDIVDSTDQAARLGDRRWKEQLDRHDEISRRVVEDSFGRVIKGTGDGMLTTFDGPGRAIRCAVALQAALKLAGLEIYVGIHTGEIELRGDDIGGIAVHIGARVMGLAAPGEILCTRTVKDLVVGSGIEFNDRGTHPLKGVPDSWQLFAVDTEALSTTQ